MVTRVLVVDDSRFFRHRIVDILEQDKEIEVVGTAGDGREALTKLIELKPDVVTMDVEMPVMDGISAVRMIMDRAPTPVLMFSSLTSEGAKATLDALEAGAVDFLPKKFSDICLDRDEANSLLQQKVRLLGGSKKNGVVKVGSMMPKAPSKPVPAKTGPVQCQIAVIGCSTGGPVALPSALKELPASFPVPILLVQHMPGGFTEAFAERMDQQCRIKVKQATDGELLKPGVAYLAPGGKQMTVDGKAGSAKVRITDGDPRNHYRPCADITFSSVADVYGGSVLCVVMTGMGADGREGARQLKGLGAEVWAQDKASSVIYGMPMAVVEAGLADRVLALPDIGSQLKVTRAA